MVKNCSFFGDLCYARWCIFGVMSQDFFGPHFLFLGKFKDPIICNNNYFRGLPCAHLHVSQQWQVITILRQYIALCVGPRASQLQRGNLIYCIIFVTSKILQSLNFHSNDFFYFQGKGHSFYTNNERHYSFHENQNQGYRNYKSK